MTMPPDDFDEDAFNATKAILRDRFTEVLQCFFEDSDIYSAAILAGVESGDLEAMIDNAHPLKSSAQAFGMMALARLAHIIEYGARDALETSTPLSDTVREACQQLSEVLAAARRVAASVT